MASMTFENLATVVYTRVDDGYQADAGCGARGGQARFQRQQSDHTAVVNGVSALDGEHLCLGFGRVHCLPSSRKDSEVLFNAECRAASHHAHPTLCG